MIRARLAHPDCNAGAIFDNLSAKYWPSTLYIVKCVMTAITPNGHGL